MSCEEKETFCKKRNMERKEGIRGGERKGGRKTRKEGGNVSECRASKLRKLKYYFFKFYFEMKMKFF